MKKVIKKTTTTVVEEVIDNKMQETLVSVILDESGSMSSVHDKTIDSFNEYVSGIKGSDKNDSPMKLTLTKFSELTSWDPNSGASKSNNVRILHENLRINKVPKLTKETYTPQGNTPLYDAIGNTIRSAEKQIGDKKDSIASLVIIITDGQENASKEFSRDSIKKLIEDKEKQGWTFVFLGANQDAALSARGIGMNYSNTMSFDPKDFKNTMGTLTNATVNYMSVRNAVGISGISGMSGTSGVRGYSNFFSENAVADAISQSLKSK